MQVDIWYQTITKIVGVEFPAVKVLQPTELSIINPDWNYDISQVNQHTVFDMNNLLEMNDITLDDIASKMPNKESETFWIGGANRDKQELFTDKDVNSDGDADIIAIDLKDLLKPEELERMNSVQVHGALRDKMIEKFNNCENPFNERFEGLKKEGKLCSEKQTSGPKGDINNNGKIDRIEAIQAVIDYFNNIITRQEAIDAVTSYFTG